MISLENKSFFSLGESLMSPTDLAQAAFDNGFESAAISDVMTVSSMVEFSKACKELGITPIIGVTLNVYDDPKYRPPKKGETHAKIINTFWRCKIFIKNDDGFRDVVALLSLANTEDYFFKVPRLGLNELTDTLSKGNVIFCSSFDASLFARADRDDIVTRIKSACDATQTLWEVSPCNTPLHDRVNELTVDNFEPGKLVTAFPTLYKSEAQAESLDILGLIVSNTKITDGWAKFRYLKDHTPRSWIDLEAATVDKVGYHHAGEAINNLNSMDHHFDYTWHAMDIDLPVMAADEMAVISAKIKRGIGNRLFKKVLGYKPTMEEIKNDYASRIRYELGILNKMGFVRYFLLVEDMISNAKLNGIPVGAARGSSAGSLVAFLIGITDVDPMRFGLIFERFINPDRLDFPDIDTDFGTERRHEVIDYLVGKYGRDCVSGISNYSMLGPSSALRDSGRVHNLSPMQMTCTKQISNSPEVTTLTEALSIADVEEFSTKHPKVWNHALNVEGAMRGYGRHAAGVAVTGQPIQNRAVLERRAGELVANWDKRLVESFGVIKLDNLGLSTLDIINRASKMIEASTGRKFDQLDMPLDDEATYDMLGEGDTIGVFQFEGGSMSNLLRSLAEGGRLTFEDLMAATSLHRPGPMESGLEDKYVSIRQGFTPEFYDHPLMEGALKQTHGVMIFQEQIMKISQDLAGFTMAEADIMRSAIGKKDLAKMMTMRDKFIAGAMLNAMNETEAEKLFTQIEKFAGYSFNKSHAAAYSIISYTAAYLKCHHKAEFFAAALSTVHDESKLKGLSRDAVKNGIKILPPDINKSGSVYTIGEVDGGTVLYASFGSLKGLSSKTEQAINDAKIKKGGDFESKADFLAHAVKRNCNIRHQSVLDAVGAFASVEPDQCPADDESRLKDQIEFLPGVVTKHVAADRKLDLTKSSKGELIKIIDDYKDCKMCSLAEQPHVLPALGTKAKIMVLLDGPSYADGKVGKLGKSGSMSAIKSAVMTAGLKMADVYITAVVKAPKTDKMYDNEQIKVCSRYLNREIEQLKPAVIIAMGRNSIYHFDQTIKGSAESLCGNVLYRKDLDASIISCISPGFIFFHPDKQSLIDDAFMEAAEMTRDI